MDNRENSGNISQIFDKKLLLKFKTNFNKIHQLIENKHLHNGNQNHDSSLSDTSVLAATVRETELLRIVENFICEIFAKSTENIFLCGNGIFL